jgi:hypothetical protein
MNSNGKYKILLADNEPQNIKDLLEAVNPDNYRMFVPSNGKSTVEKHPELTSTEKKICTFLKMNMNTKEIAVLPLSTPASIEVSRARIRKKFELDHHESLTGYIAGI